MLEQIPLYPDTKILSENDVLAEPLAESLRQSTGIEDMQVQMLVVNLTGDSSWTRIKNFYATAAEGMGWEPSDDYEKNEDHVKVAGWTRGGWSPDQRNRTSRRSTGGVRNRPRSGSLTER